MDFHDVVAWRRSIRSYRPDPVSSEALAHILEAGRLAPTAANRQPFRILVFSGEAREQLRRAYGADWFLDAPVIILVCSVPEEAWCRKDGKNYADVDATIVMDHIILAAHADGLGTCWIGAFDPQALRDDVGLDPALDPVAMTPVGHPAEDPPARDRKPLAELVQNFGP